MPSVPMLNRPQVAPNVRRAIDVPVASTGAGAAAMGLSVAADAFQKERERAGQIRANAAEAEIRQVSSRLATEVERMQRTQALGAEDLVAEKWGTEVSRITAGISDPAVRQAVEARANILRDELQGRARTHASRQAEVVRTESFKANQASDLETLVATPDSAPRVLGSIEQRTRDNALAEGKPKEVVDFEVAQAVSVAQYARVVGLVQNNRTEEAATLLEQPEFRGALQAKELQDAQRLVKGERTAARAQSIRDEAIRQFGEDERAALQWVHDTYKGDEENQAAQAVEVHYATQRRLRNQEIDAYSTEAVNAAYAGQPIPPATRQWLETNGQGKVLAAAAAARVQAASGTPVETSLVALQELIDLTLPENRQKFLDMNLLEYAGRVSRTDLAQFMTAQAAFKGGTRRPSEGISTTATITEAFNRMRSANLLDPRVTRLGDIENRPEDRGIYDTVMEAVNIALSAEQAALKSSVPPARAREIIQKTVDGFTIEKQGVLFRTRTAVPITDEGRQTRSIEQSIRATGFEVTPAKVEAIRLLFTRTDLTPEQKATLADSIARGQ